MLCSVKNDKNAYGREFRSFCIWTQHRNIFLLCFKLFLIHCFKFLIDVFLATNFGYYAIFLLIQKYKYIMLFYTCTNIQHTMLFYACTNKCSDTIFLLIQFFRVRLVYNDIYIIDQKSYFVSPNSVDYPNCQPVRDCAWEAAQAAAPRFDFERGLSEVLVVVFSESTSCSRSAAAGHLRNP